jgi:hypothetical protein
MSNKSFLFRKGFAVPVRGKSLNCRKLDNTPVYDRCAWVGDPVSGKIERQVRDLPRTGAQVLFLNARANLNGSRTFVSLATDKGKSRSFYNG